MQKVLQYTTEVNQRQGAPVFMINIRTHFDKSCLNKRKLILFFTNLLEGCSKDERGENLHCANKYLYHFCAFMKQGVF